MHQWQQTQFTVSILLLCVALFFSMMLLMEVGRRLGHRAIQRHGQESVAGLSGVDAAIYSLLALLMGFAFSGAAGRFESRKRMVVDEVSALSTAWQRTLLLPAGARDTVQAGMRKYTDALLAAYEAPNASEEEHRAREAVSRAENEIWTQSLGTCMANTDKPICVLLIPSLNELFDVVDKERLDRYIHLPRIVLVMLLVAALAASIFAGYTMAKSPTRNWIFMLGIATTISLTTYVIVELEYPRAGLIHVDAFDTAIREFRATMR